MKTLKKIVAIALLLSCMAMIFVSCDSRESNVIASFDGNYIYNDDNDYKNFYNLNIYYYALESGEAEMSVYDYNTILGESVESTVTMRLLEQQLADRGYTIDMKAVEEAAADDREIYDKAYPGGFEMFCRHWNLSEDVFVMINKFEAMKDIVKNIFVKVDRVTEKDVEKYYNDNKDSFIQNPHFEVKTIFLQILHTADKNECESVYNDAKLYIESLNSGKSWEYVKDTVARKYNLEHGMTFSHYLTGTQSIAKSDFISVEDFTTALNQLDKEFELEHGVKFEEMFPDGFYSYAEENKLAQNTTEYNKAWETYMNYCSNRYNLEFRYAITVHWETGKTYSSPIYHSGYDSYVILTFSEMEDGEGHVTYEEAKDGIMEKMKKERQEKALESYISKMLNEAKIQIKYN